jgi:hypothetical protein
VLHADGCREPTLVNDRPEVDRAEKVCVHRDVRSAALVGRCVAAVAVVSADVWGETRASGVVT